MDRSPALAERARLRLPSPLALAVAFVLLSAGGAFGWRLQTGAPSARPTPAVAAAALDLERTEAAPLCAPDGAESVRDRALEGTSPGGGDRLAGYLPARSPLPGYDRAGARAVDGATEVEFVAGAVDGHVASFRPEGEGGFDVYAFRFLARKDAAAAIADHVVRRVCDFGAAPLAARGRPGLIVLEERRGAERSSAWWMTRSDVIVVRYAAPPGEDAATSLANLAAIAGATALY
ncbi:MAG TPA: hypothetical protein VHN37_11245 [Actinomycetota bacterium]|nr:hypothetical protein [Actinomycetota bacterium]